MEIFSPPGLCINPTVLPAPQKPKTQTSKPNIKSEFSVALPNQSLLHT